MSDWSACPDCGRTMPEADMQEHRCHGGGPRVENTQAKRWPFRDPEVLHRKHRAHIARLQNEAEKQGEH